MRWLAITLFVVFAITDWYTTKRALVDRKGFKEALLAKFLLAHGVRTYAAIIKVAFWCLLWFTHAPLWVWWMYAGLQAGASVWNWRLLQKPRG